VNRRALLRASGLAGAASLIPPLMTTPASAGPAGQAGASPQPGAPKSAAADSFFHDPDLNYTFLILLGSAVYQLAEVGACLAIADHIQDGNAASAFQALVVAGDRLAGLADEAAAAGRLVSARSAYLQASNYTFAATYFVDRMGAPDRFAPTWRRQQALWDQGAALFDPPVEQVAIPYQDTTLPGYFFKVDESGQPRSLLILNNGSDGALQAAWSLGGASALERGYNYLTFYGPGQGAALVEQGLFFRPDWEEVITPVVDYALSRPEVDPARIGLIGISQGGYWVPRAMAFEHRVAAAVADPGVWDVSTVWTANLPAALLGLLAAGKQAEFDQALRAGMASAPAAAATLAFRMRPFGFTSLYDAFTAVKQYTLADVVGQITCPLLVTDPEGEQFWPGQSQQVYQALPGPKSLLPFTRAEGADLHCEPKTPGLRAQRIFDWLDATLA
jgi:Prolyl oligopeptidase family